jgi:hypothetical protein
MVTMMTAQSLKGIARPRRAIALPAGLTIGELTKRLVSIASAACIATILASAAASPQRPKPTPVPAPGPGPVTAMVVMTPNGPATCATWVQWRSPSAHPMDKAAIEYWTEGYLSGLAAGSHHDVIGQFRRDALAAWLDRYCTANPQTPLPAAVNALGRQMLAHPGGPL